MCRALAVPSTAVENRSPVISFGISSGDKRSAYWRVRSGMKKPELFIEREDHGALWHLSLHESGRWHLKMTNEARVHWVRPAEMVPGYTRAVGIVVPYMVTYKEDAAPAGVELVPIEPHSDPMTFSLFIEEPGANLDGWPGKNAMGTALVGRLPLAGGAGTCCVVAHQEELGPASWHFSRPTDEALAWMRESVASGSLYMTVVGEMGDGAIALIELRANPAVLSLPAAAE